MSASPPRSLRAWRVPRGTRWALATALMALAVGSGVWGQAMLTGFASLGVLMLSAVSLAGLTAFLLWAYQGDIVVQDGGLALPGGGTVPHRRVLRCHAEQAPGGGVLVIELAMPAEERRVRTGQPLPEVEDFARAVPTTG